MVKSRIGPSIDFLENYMFAGLGFGLGLRLDIGLVLVQG